MTGPEDWYLSAEARWKHLPAGQDRESHIRETFFHIRDESEAAVVRLPTLTESECTALLEEAILDTWARYGCPTTDTAETIFEHNTDLLFYRLCLRAREAKAEPYVRSKLLERRLLRMPGIRSYLGLKPE